MLVKLMSVLLAVISMNASAAQRWVPPPAPQIDEGTPIRVEAETDKKGFFILHLPKPKQVDARQTRYRVEIKRSDEQPFEASLETRWFAQDDEVVFVKVAPGSESKYVIEVVDYASRPFVRVFQGTLASVPEIPD